MQNFSLVKYSLFNTVTLFFVAFSVYFLHSVNFLLDIDATGFTFLIASIYFALTVYIGIVKEKTQTRIVDTISSTLTSVGLVGTVIGTMLLFNRIGAMNLTNISQVIPVLFTGVSMVLITTAFGMAFSTLMDYQLLFVFGDHTKNDEN